MLVATVGAFVIGVSVCITPTIATQGLQCIADPYPDGDTFDMNLAGAVECFREAFGDAASNGSTDGLWYSSNTNDEATLELNSEIAWGFSDSDVPPSIIARPRAEGQAKAALSCSIKNGMRVVPWSKGHNLQGLTALPNYVLIRLDNICDVSVNYYQKTMTISAGCSVGYQVGKLSLFGEDTDNRLLLNFGCPNIGIGGSLSGGGQGYMSGFLGMQIDRVKSVRFMLYDRKGQVEIVEARHDNQYKDLFFAARGGMGGYGTILDITLQTLPTPSANAVTWVDLYYKEATRGTAFYRFQQLLLKDKRFGIAQTNRFDLDGVQLRVSFLGPAHLAIMRLIEAGMIDTELIDIEGTYSLTPNESSFIKDYNQKCTGTNCSKFKLPPRGVNIFSFPNFREFSGLAWFNPATVNTENVCGPQYGFDCGPNSGQGIDGQYYFISQQENALAMLVLAEDANSDLLNPTSSFWQRVPASFFSTPGHQWRLTEEGWNELAKVRSRSASDGCNYGFLFPHATGGVAAKVPVAQTAYPWRGHPLVGVTAGDLSGPECVETLQGISDVRKIFAVEGFERTGAYINYPGNPNNCCNAAEDQPWTDLYYGDNYHRLQWLRNKYDPLQVYSKTQLPELKKDCKAY